MEICHNSGLPIPMVPQLHQSNGHIKRNLRVWKAEKCNAIVGEDTVFTFAGPQTTPFLVLPYKAENGNMRYFGPTTPHGAAFTPKQCFYQKEGTGMESAKMYCTSRCRHSTCQCGAANYLVSWVAI